MANQRPEVWMRRAIALSRRGLPAPNPHVGCVIVRDGEIVGEGWHHVAGSLHAEADALRHAGERAKGSDVFCTMEPCNHVGRQPACSTALLNAQVRRVWYACADPNPRVAGGGGSALRAAGIEVHEGLLEQEAAAANRTWLLAMARQRPFVTLKAAMTMDGRVGLPSGESRWITGERARRAARRLRAEMGSVLVGAGTVLADDPQLTARIRNHPNEPVRLILDPTRRLSDTARVFSGPGHARRFVAPERATGRDSAVAMVGDRFDLDDLMRQLWHHGVTGVLVEGGAATLSSFFEAGLADRIELFVGNVAFGGGLPWLAAPAPKDPAAARRWRLVHARKLDEDVWLRYEPVE